MRLFPEEVLSAVGARAMSIEGGKTALLIREAGCEELERLHEIDRAAFDPALAYSRAELRFYLTARRSRTLAAELGGVVVGFVVVRCLGGQRGTVITLDVAPGHQRQGIGGELLRAVEAWLLSQGVREVRLETPADESGARQFYEKHGYLLDRRLRGYYNGALDAFSMVKRF
jgi:ribosomal protein S18 acetylase RimI-like enzyme